MGLKPCLCFLELPQLQAIFDAIKPCVHLQEHGVEIVYVALMRVQNQTHGIQFVTKIADGVFRSVRSLVEATQELLNKVLRNLSQSALPERQTGP